MNWSGFWLAIEIICVYIGLLACYLEIRKRLTKIENDILHLREEMEVRLCKNDSSIH